MHVYAGIEVIISEKLSAYLVLSALGGYSSIDWDHQQHEHKPGKYCIAHREVEEHEGEHDLKRSGPDHVDIGHQVHESLGVHRHEVDNLSHRLVTT